MPRLGYSKSRNGCLRCKQRRVKVGAQAYQAGGEIGTDSRVLHSVTKGFQRARHVSGTTCPAVLVTPANLSVCLCAPPPLLPPPSFCLWLTHLHPQPGAGSAHHGTGTDHGSQGPSPSNRTRTPLTGSPSSTTYPSAEDPNPFPYLSNLVRSQGETHDFRTWTTDLELMHHYTVVSWRTLPRPDEMAHIWQLQMPQIAFSHDFLMHQILAISAAHLAHLQCDSQERRTAYSLCATQHQNRALQRLQEVLPHIDETNCAAIFLTASLLSIGAFAALSESTRDGETPGIDELLQVLLLLRGMYGILSGFYGILKLSIIGTLLTPGDSASNSPLLAEIAGELAKHRVLLTGTEDDERRDLVKDDLIIQALDSFLYWIQHASGTVEIPERRVVMTWPTRMTDGFITLVRERDSDALRLLACYGRILEALGPSHWYLMGLGETLLADIHRTHQ